jgi:predicted transposase YbfD/YdcC
MDKEAFGKVLHEWSKELLEFLDFHQINIDGKVVRATAEGGKKKSGICLVSAWVAEQRLVVGQEKVDKKSNEKTAIPQLINTLDLQGALVSIDAMGCQVSIGEQIIEKGGDYLLSLKKNQACLYEQVSEWMQANKAAIACYETVEESAGRFERRRCYVTDQIHWMDDLADWPAVKRVVMIESNRQKGDKIVSETRYYLSSLAENAFAFCGLIRNHWSIENELHWFLDVVFDEDRSTTRKDNGAENLSTIRKLALQILRQTDDKHSIHHRRMKAAWNHAYLLQVLQNAFNN